jgi:uncharacterized membrane protein
LSKKNIILRHIIKTISYRFLATFTTMAVAYYLGASLEISSLLGIGEIIIKPIIYFIHERIWYKSKFLIKNENYE